MTLIRRRLPCRHRCLLETRRSQDRRRTRRSCARNCPRSTTQSSDDVARIRERVAVQAEHRDRLHVERRGCDSASVELLARVRINPTRSSGATQPRRPALTPRPTHCAFVTLAGSNASPTLPMAIQSIRNEIRQPPATGRTEARRCRTQASRFARQRCRAWRDPFENLPVDVCSAGCISRDSELVRFAVRMPARHLVVRITPASYPTTRFTRMRILSNVAPGIESPLMTSRGSVVVAVMRMAHLRGYETDRPMSDHPSASQVEIPILWMANPWAAAILRR